MKDSLTKALIILIGMTLLVAVFSNIGMKSIAVLSVVLISVAKFLIVGFEFMELKKAHSFWKGLLVFYSVLIGGLFVLFLI